MVLKHWTLFVLMIHALWPGIYGYRTMYITRPKNGFYCRDGHLQIMTDADQQQCTRNCLINQACRVMSYNQKDHLCVLGEFASDVAVRHPEYMLMVFRSDHWDRIIWKPKSGPFHSRTIYTRHVTYTYTEALCGKQAGPDFLIGHGGADYFSYFSERSTGGQHYGMGSFVLTVNPVCTVAWIPFDAGSTILGNALLCGYLAAVGPTYCARMVRAEDKEITFGYYDEVDEMAYYAWGGLARATEMDILIRV